MMEMMMLTKRYLAAGVVMMALMGVVGGAWGQDRKAVSAEKRSAAMSVLNSNAPKPEKAIACKQLAIYGNAEAVGALAGLLGDAELSSWARIALERIPEPAVDDALREAMGKVKGRELVGVIHSIGMRKDAKAVGGLIEKLKGQDKDAAAAAAIALGKIGGEQAATALEGALAAEAVEVRSAAAEGEVLVAEVLLAKGEKDRAVKLYDTVRKANVPKQRVHEATRGAILARGVDGVPLLLEQLRATDKGANDIALSTARELSGEAVTDAIVRELASFIPERQAQLLQVLADRSDAKAKALPVALAALKNGAGNVKVVAAMVLERLGDTSAVGALVDAAAGEEAELAMAAKTSLARLSGKEIDDAIFAQLQQASGKMRVVLIELAEQRKLEGAMPVFIKSAEDSDPKVRTAALVAIGAIGDDKQMPDLVKLYLKAREEDRAAIERAVNSIASRWGAASVGHLAPLTKSEDSATRIAAIKALAACGGNAALNAVKGTLEDKEEAVRDEAVRTLSTWPNRWRDDVAVTEPLLAVAKGGEKASHKILALRGYLQFVQGARKISADEKMEKLNAVLPLISRPEEKRLAISALGGITTPGALKALVEFAGDAAVAEEAYSAIVTVAGRNDRSIAAEDRRKALAMVGEKSKSDSLKAKAQEAMKNVK